MPYTSVWYSWSSMANLLCITPSPGLKTHYGRIPANLTPHWGSDFKEVAVWSSYGNTGWENPHGRVWESDEPFEKRAQELGKIVQDEHWSHIWILGDLAFLTTMVKLGLTSPNLPNTLIYAYAIIDTQFIDSQYVYLGSHFDFMVCMSGMAMGAYVQLVTELREQVPKELFKAIQRQTVISPGVDREVFRKLNQHAGEPYKEELRYHLFDGKVSPEDFLVLVTGQSTVRKGLPQSLGTIRQLKDRLDRPVKGYLHLDPSKRGVDVGVLVHGNDLLPGEDIMGFTGKELVSDEHMNQLYNACDLLLCSDMAGGWPFSATEAMAAGCLVAAPDDHVWLEVVTNGRGVELPADLFTRAPWSPEEYTRCVTPGSSADAIAKVVRSYDKQAECTDTAYAWAHTSPHTSWEASADKWRGLFGV